MFKLSKENIKSALVYGLLSGILAIFMYALEVGDLFKLDWKALVNAGVFAFMIAMVSVIKNLLTSDEGKFLGITTVIPDKK